MTRNGALRKTRSNAIRMTNISTPRKLEIMIDFTL